VRTITTTLTAAINAGTRRPAIMLSAEDHINHLQQMVTTAGNVDGWSDMCVAHDGSIVRVRVTWGGGGSDFVQSFQWQRIIDPTNAAQWQNWTTFGGASGNMWDDGSCAISNNSGILRAFAQQGTGGAAIWCWTSMDNGQSWSSSPATVATLPGGASIKGIGSAGNNDAFFLYDTYGGEAVGACFYTTAWGSLITSSLPLLFEGKGLASVWNSGVYTLVYADPYNVYSATYTPSTGSWSAVNVIAPTTTTAIGRRSPRIALVDGIYNLVYVEEDSGVLTGSVYNYPRVRQSVDLQNWSSGFILHDMPTTFGANLVACTPPGTTRARYVAASASVVELGTAFLTSDANQYVDLSAYVLEYQRIEEIGKVGRLTVVLDNSGSALTSMVAQYGVNYKPIGINTTLVLSEGYKTGHPPITSEVVTVGKYHIKQIAIERAAGESRIQLVAEDVSSLLDQENRYQVSYSNPVLQPLMQQICTLAGVLHTNIPGLTQLESSVLTFVLHAGQKYRQAFDELCRIGWVEYFLDENEILQVRELSNTDPVVWSYSPEIETLVIGSDDIRMNHLIVSGKPPAGPTVALGSITSAEVFDDLHMHATGLERVSMYTDVKLFTNLLCSRKAAFLMQQEQRDQVAHRITVSVNPALQLLDVISVTDQGGTVSGTNLAMNGRIYRQEITYRVEAAIYQQTLFLEGM
jgi:hypothetical protein